MRDHRSIARAVAHALGICHCSDSGCEPGPEDDLVREVKRLQSIERDAALVMHRRVDWSEDDGNVLWWTWPITEPPYCGTELDDDLPEYVTHWTRLPDQQALEVAHAACESLVRERMLR